MRPSSSHHPDSAAVPFVTIGAPRGRKFRSGVTLLARFDIEERLGAGSMGHVFAAFDRQRQARVAVKVLGELNPQAIADLKTEFRAASEVVHPNLVRLHELFCEDAEWFFTMDLVDGVTLPQLLLTQRERDMSELRRVFRQLAEALAALHRAGTLHRDLKPSNFLITRESGRVVLLDFGLATPIGALPGGEFAGTPAYMAPEQCWGDSLTEAADWYAFGVVLYEALTGGLPNRMPSREQLAAAPADLASLALALMNLDPTRRPDAGAVLRCIAEGISPAARFSVPNLADFGGDFIGRGTEVVWLERGLERTLAGLPNVVLVRGPSGIGKSALIDHFAKRAALQGACVLRSRCRERESMSYKAVDGLIDDLVDLLGQWSTDEVDSVLPAGIAELTVLFPALRTNRQIAAVPNRHLESSDRALLRLRAIEAFAELLRRLRKRGPVVVWIDDLQWSDAESALLLEPVLGGPEQIPLLVVGSSRDDAELGGPLFEALNQKPRFEMPSVQRIELGPLPAEHAAQLASKLLGEDAQFDPESIARDSGGHPLFVQELAYVRSHAAFQTRGGESLAELVERRLAALDATATRLLRLCTLAGTPLPRHTLRSLCELKPAGAETALDVLRAARLARSQGPRDEDLVDVYHDRIREIVADGMTSEEAVDAHTRIAETLETGADVRHELIAHHFENAGQPQRAAPHWIAAADGAVQSLAFNHAISLYERGLRSLQTDAQHHRDIETRHAEAMAYAGRGPAAADLYLSLAQDSNREMTVEFQRRAAEQLLLSGHLDRGLKLMDTISHSLGMPTAGTGKRALLSVATGRVRVRLRGFRHRLRTRDSLSATDSTKLDVTWTLACSLGLIHPVVATYYHNKHLLMALEAGEPLHLLRALALEASYCATPGGRPSKRGERLIEIAEGLAERLDDPVARGLYFLARGISAYLAGDTASALPLCLHSADYFVERQGTTWETISARRFAIAALFLLGRFEELGRFVPPLLGSAEGTGNRYASMCFRSAYSTVAWLVRDDVAEAQMQLERARSECNPHDYHLSHYNLLLGETFFDLYRGSSITAYERIEAQWSQLENSQLLRVGVVRAQIWQFRASTAAAAALTLEADRQTSRAQTLRTAALAHCRRLHGDPIARAGASGFVTEAALQFATGEPSDAVALLRRALQCYESLDAAMYVAAVKAQLASLLEGDEADELRNEAASAMDAQHVLNRRNMVRMLAPGFR